VLNHVFVMNVAMIRRPRNVYNQYYFALDSTFLEAKLTRPRPAEAKILVLRPVWPRDLNITVQIICYFNPLVSDFLQIWYRCMNYCIHGTVAP